MQDRRVKLMCFTNAEQQPYKNNMKLALALHQVNERPCKTNRFAVKPPWFYKVEIIGTFDQMFPFFVSMSECNPML